ncbi:hypothetical protein E2562_012645 [Oryza meyeriana var. granulata]|uniref:Uncharacterized protein n=1 Tax=Oryza meyeriana var. granulata TaxID=110450 RepID=A0A6G1CFV9_9ORYZ|nr:hypothetical protein E2562_012645 [Oryza meyeriana var. granulata]
MATFRDHLVVIGEAVCAIAADAAAAARAMDPSTVISLACAAFTVAVVLVCYADICGRLAALNPQPQPQPAGDKDNATPPQPEAPASASPPLPPLKESSTSAPTSANEKPFSSAVHKEGKEEPFAVDVRVKHRSFVVKIKLVASLIVLNQEFLLIQELILPSG